MIEFLKENWQWLGAVVVPIIAAIIGAVSIKGRKQKVGDINGDGNHVINGNEH